VNDASPPFAARIVDWQRRHGRHDLPWQRTRDPYPIWVSEIMLQQTQVAAVIPYFVRFVARFPDVHALAAAPPADVMAAWAGLGYYSRARNLHRCAQAVVERHGGRFPATAAALAALPGIGRSTAAAIAAFAYGERAAILDGNVQRVFARQFGIEGAAGSAPVLRRMWPLAESLVPVSGIAEYTQGLMDLGATLCTRVRPKCSSCPVAATCVARADRRTAELPAPRAARARPLRTATVAIIRDADGALLLEARPPAGIWGGLMSLPEFTAELPDAQLVRAIADRYSLDVVLGARLRDVPHDFTHFRLVLQPRLAEVRRTGGVAETSARFIAAASLADVALPAPIRRLLQQIDEPLLLT
jgi:A/G-specific adenine glycosylase